MNLNYLDFERPIIELEMKINELRNVGSDADLNISAEIEKLHEKKNQLTKNIFSSLTDWQIVKLARHPQRPYFLDYVSNIFTDFDELHGDRLYKNDDALIGGVAYLDEQAVMVIGHQKGRTVKEKVRRNFGMANPEGYRKAKRLMLMAEKFNLPILTFIDTAGAYPGVGAEERGQSEAIATNLALMSNLKVPIICTVIGEGGSGGALAIGVGDSIMMLDYSIYSVISPEGCASILWKDAAFADTAAQSMNLTASKLQKLGLIDRIIEEPLGGAHTNHELTASNIKLVLTEQLAKLKNYTTNELLEYRYKKLMAFGKFEGDNY